MATILITGGAGFIGSHTADALIQQGHHVRALDILDPQIHGEGVQRPEYLNSAVELIRGDVRDPADVQSALDGVDAVYHFATLNGVGQSMYDLRSYVETNDLGTATLLEAIVKRDRPLSRFVLATSRAVYGEGTFECARCGTFYPTSRCREDMDQGRFGVYCPHCEAETQAVATGEERPLNPTSIYGWTKKHQEDLCRHVAQSFGLPIVCLRYFNVYGSRQSLRNPYTGVVSVFYGRLLAGQPISLYEHGAPGRDFVHVTDIAQANRRALEADVEPGTVINIGTGVRSSILDVANALSHATGQTTDLLDRGEFRAGDICCCYADISRAKRLLGYAPQVSLEEGMGEFARWAGTEESVDMYEKTVQELQQYGLFGVAQA